MATVTLHVTAAGAGGKMKLTELVEIAPEKVDKTVYGVEVDDYCVSRQFGVEEIGLVVEADENGVINEDVIDVATDYVDAGCKVLLEVHADCPVNSSYMYMMASNIGATISVLPPKNANDHEISLYADRLCEYAKEWINDGESHLMLEPVSGYFQYLINQAYGYQPEFIAIDEYMKTEFVKPLKVEDMDFIKDQLRETIFAAFDGESEFKKWAHSLGKALNTELIQLTQ